MIDVLILTDIAAVIGMLVPRKTFVGIGGLWGLKNEIVAPALRAGVATSAMMADIVPQCRGLSFLANFPRFSPQTDKAH